MANAQVVSNTDPDASDRRRLESGGPLGFIMAVHQTLRMLDRPYYFAGAVPPFLQARESDDEQEDVDFSEEYARFLEEPVKERSLRETEHCVIHQWRQYPAKIRYAGTTDSPTGARRQKTPKEKINHDRPLPNEQDTDDDVADRTQRTGAFAEKYGRPPLWDSKEQVPDLISDYVDADTAMVVTPWEFDVFVDFTLIAANMHLLAQMEQDFMNILKTFHERWATGASNISGWFYQSVPGSSPDIQGEIRSDYPTRTITWRLKQSQAWAFPIKKLREIQLEIYGTEFM